MGLDERPCDFAMRPVFAVCLAKGVQRNQAMKMARKAPESRRALRAPDCQKTLGELERAEALSNSNRTRRRVRRGRGDF